MEAYIYHENHTIRAKDTGLVTTEYRHNNADGERFTEFRLHEAEGLLYAIENEDRFTERSEGPSVTVRLEKKYGELTCSMSSSSFHASTPESLDRIIMMLTEARATMAEYMQAKGE